MRDILGEVSASVIAGDMAACKRLTEEALALGLSAKDVLDKGLMAGMDVVGERFRRQDMFVPEVLLAARSMQAAMNILRPGLMDMGVKAPGKVIIGTVKGDLHDIGKNLVVIMLQGAGFEVKDLGTNVSPDQFVAAIKAEQPDVVGLSALLTTTMEAMADTIRSIQEAGLREDVKVIVGGAPVTQHYADEVGADGYGANAGAAVEMARRLIGVAV